LLDTGCVFKNFGIGAESESENVTPDTSVQNTTLQRFFVFSEKKQQIVILKPSSQQTGKIKQISLRQKYK